MSMCVHLLGVSVTCIWSQYPTQLYSEIVSIQTPKEAENFFLLKELTDFLEDFKQ